MVRHELATGNLNKRNVTMNSSAKKIINKGPAMITALSLNGLAGIASGIHSDSEFYQM